MKDLCALCMKLRKRFGFNELSLIEEETTSLDTVSGTMDGLRKTSIVAATEDGRKIVLQTRTTTTASAIGKQESDGQDTQSLDSGAFTASEDCPSVADETHLQEQRYKKWNTHHLARILSKYLGVGHKRLDKGNEGSSDNVTQKDDATDVKRSSQVQKNPSASYDVNRSSNAEERRKNAIQTQLRRHTFGRVKNYVANKPRPEKPQNKLSQKLRLGGIRSTPATPRRALTTPRPTRSALTTPRSPGSALNTPRVFGETLPQELPSLKETEKSELTKTSPLTCFENPVSVWRVRVWIEFSSATEFSQRHRTIQICHACKPTCNFRRDVRKWLPKDLDKVAWYRLLGRQVEVELGRLTDGDDLGGANIKDKDKAEAIKEEQKRNSVRACSRCGTGFSILFNRRLECAICGLGVCAKCAKWNADAHVWRCLPCCRELEFRAQSCEWFYGHLQEKLNDFGTAKVVKSVGYNNYKATVDPATATVRDHIEKVVESLVGDNLDSVNIIRLSNEPDYERLFAKYHQHLSDSLAQLAQAITIVIQNCLSDPDDPTPTSAHIVLKSWVEKLMHDVAEHPINQEGNASADMIPRELPADNEMYFADSYEDLLATAIINKVASSQRVPRIRHNPVQDVQTPDESKAFHSAVKSRKSSSPAPSTSSSFCNTTRTPGSSSSSRVSRISPASSDADEESCSSTFSSFSRSQMSVSPAQLQTDRYLTVSSESPQFLIEEEIVEVTEFVSDNDDSGDGLLTLKVTPSVSLSKCPSMHSVDSVLADMDTEPDNRVAFPEYGMDLIEYTSDLEEDQLDTTSMHLMETAHWQDNWLFCQKKKTALSAKTVRNIAADLLIYEKVAMLVPNPDNECRAAIGMRDVDELSELSEVSASESHATLSFSETEEELASNNTDDIDVITDNGSQRYLEHTEYAVLPQRKLSDSSPKQQEQESCDLRFLINPRNLKIKEGGLVKFMCQVDGAKPIDVLWFHGEQPLEPDNRIDISRIKANTYILTIFGAKSEDSGQFRCVAYNRSGEISHDFHLVVSEALKGQQEDQIAPSISNRPKDLVIEEKETKVFRFKVSGYPEPRMMFFRNGKRLKTNETFAIDHMNRCEWSLTVKRASTKVSGQFEAKAMNEAGLAETRWIMKVKPMETIPEKSVSNDDERAVETYLREAEKNSNRSAGIEQSKLLASSSLSPRNHKESSEHEHVLSEESKTARSDESSSPSNMTATEEQELLDLDRPLARPGTIADREHRKWIENAIPLANNPYSKENIERRLSKVCLSSPTESSPIRVLPRSTSTSHFSDSHEGDADETGHDVVIPDHLPGRIDCGLRSINASMYGRDYYVHGSSTSSSSSSSSIKASSGAKSSKKEPKPIPVVPQVEEVKRESSKEPSSSEESDPNLMDSLDPNDSRNPADSGLGSSSERASVASKVGSEVMRFQREIERSAKEQAIQKEWLLRKRSGSAKKALGSVDSLLMSTESDGGYLSPPELPPRGKGKTNPPMEDEPPALPPKKRDSTKKVSISTQEPAIIGEDGPMRRDLVPKEALNSRRSIQDKQVSTSEERDEYDSEDSLATLPSVKELASKFMPKKSPEPVPRKSLHKKRKENDAKKAKNLESKQIVEIHSLTARSVPRHFREGLKKGMPCMADKNIRIPPKDNNNIHEDNLVPLPDQQHESSSNLTIVYDSENKDLVPYPKGEFIRTPSPEHSGIPARPVTIMTPRQAKEIFDYTSDDSSNLSSVSAHQQPRSLRKSSSNQNGNYGIKKKWKQGFKV